VRTLGVGKARVAPAVFVLLLALVLPLLPVTPAGASLELTPAEGMRLTTIVGMGDSTLSGEGAGDYLPGTDRPGNFCHRSARSEIELVTVASIERHVDLACSGATSDQVRIGGQRHFDEVSQGDQLVALARTADVQWVVLQVGANDEIAFSDLVVDCVKGYLIPFRAGCRNKDGPSIQARIQASAARVARVIDDVASVLHAEGVPRDHIVLQSYASPVSEHIRLSLLRAAEGCPFELADMKWARTVVVPSIAQAYAALAARAGVRYLDLSSATEGHEVCAAGATRAQEWVKGVSISAGEVLKARGNNVVQESFHPNAAGHAELARCLSEFLVTTHEAARCVVGSDAHLHAVRTQLV